MDRDELRGGPGDGRRRDVLGPGDAEPRPPLPRRVVGLGAAVALLLAGGVAATERPSPSPPLRPALAVAGLSALEAGPGAADVAVDVDLVNRGPGRADVTGTGLSLAGLRLVGAEAALPREDDGRLLRIPPGETRTVHLSFRVEDCVGLRLDRVDLPLTVRLSDGSEEQLLLDMPTADGTRRRLPVNGRGPLRRDLDRPREWQGLLVEPVCRGALPTVELTAVSALAPGRDGGPRLRAELRLDPDRVPLRVSAVRGSSGPLQVEATRLTGAPAGAGNDVSYDFRVRCEAGPLREAYEVAVVVLDDDRRTVRTLRVRVRVPPPLRADAERLIAEACPPG